MGFWIYMIVMVLLCPATMMFFGGKFFKAAPKNINMVFGYRTSMSMKNSDTWDFAHKCCGRIWFYTGLVLIPVSVIPMLFVIGENIDTVGIVGIVLAMIDVVIMCLTIIPVESALKRNFDKNGIRKK